MTRIEGKAASRSGRGWLSRAASAVLAGAVAVLPLSAPALADDGMDARIAALTGELEAYVQTGMTAFDNPGLAIGIVSGDRLVYAKGFGTRSKGGEPVDMETIFQIGSTTKAFLATTMAIAADRDKLAWDARVVDLEPEFAMKDPWVTREFRVFDLLAQRSGMPPYANDAMGLLGADKAAMMRAMRHVEPVSSFRSSFAYTNVTHMVAERIVARQLGAADWDSVVRDEIFAPLAMTSTSLTAEAIEAAPNHTEGHRWEPTGTVQVPFTPIFPYGFGAAGAINSNIEDLSKWLRLHLAAGEYEGRRIVSAANLAVTTTPRIGMSDKVAYGMGWVLQFTPNGRYVWHNGGTMAFGSFIGMAPDHDVGVIVLSNETNVGFPDALGEWTLDHLLGNPVVDHVANRLKAAEAGFAASSAIGAIPAERQPPTLLAPLAGDYESPSFGPARVAAEGDELVVSLISTGARLKLQDRGGQSFNAMLVPEGRFAAIAAGNGSDPSGLIQFETDATGGIGGFRFIDPSNGQVYSFARR